jgi:hypothetical protein
MRFVWRPTVASSSTRMLLGVKRARARETSCRCPWLRLDPVVKITGLNKIIPGDVNYKRMIRTSFMDCSIKLAIHASDMVLQSRMSCRSSVSEAGPSLGCTLNIPNTPHSSVSSWTCLGSKLSRTVPSNNAASWGMIARRPLKSSKPIDEISKPSMLRL